MRRCVRAAGWVGVLPRSALKVGDTRPGQVSTLHPYPLGDASRPMVWTGTIRSASVTFLGIHLESAVTAREDLWLADPDQCGALLTLAV